MHLLHWFRSGNLSILYAFNYVKIDSHPLEELMVSVVKDNLPKLFFGYDLIVSQFVLLAEFLHHLGGHVERHLA
jgi:hypothetical protein